MTETTDTKNITPEGMKMQALVERIAELTAEYENKVADLRVAFTMVSQERDDLAAQVQELSPDATDHAN